MSANLFVTISIILNLILGVAVLFRNYRTSISIPLICTGILLPISSFWGINLIDRSTVFIPDNIFYFFLIHFICALSITLLIKNFMQKDNHTITFKLPNLKIDKRPVKIVLLSVLSLFLILFTLNKDFRAYALSYSNQHSSTISSIFYFLLISLYIYSSYLLESAFRYAKEYQRRIGRLFFVSISIIIIYNLFLFTTTILYNKIFLVILQSGLVITGVCYPVALLGFLRYRLGFEQIYIQRNAVYSSVSLLLIGAFFLGTGLTLYLFKLLHINFEYFEWAIILFTVSFLLILAVCSGQMRRRIILFINNNFYSCKYDYRDQFYRLHKTYMYGNSLNESVINLVENMKYAVAANDAFVFLREPHNYSFVLRKNPEFSTVKEHITLYSNDPLITAFENSFEPLDTVREMESQRVKNALEHSKDALKHLAPSIIFPIPYNNTLIGLLLLDIGNRLLDTEDFTVIKVFTEAIGYTYYKDHILQTTIENSQFQSFNQVASFVIHDIKNQIATLSLLAKNADQYIDNVEFQKSLIRSIYSCSGNLTQLVEKLSSNRKEISFSTSMQPIIPILEKVANNDYVKSNNQVKIEWIGKKSCEAIVDQFALEQVLLNLMKNAIEAMSHNGTLRLYCSFPEEKYPEQLNHFNLPPSTLFRKSAIILIEDSGCGMDKDFIKSRLFKPFETTKDKGIGIGLYQCKVYVEKMNGMLLCDSKPNKGTTFCILL